jgi:hypothetical protein
VLLHRYLRDGARPAVVVLEVMPGLYAKENDGFVSGHFAFTDMPVARPYAEGPLGFDYHFLRHRLRRVTDLARVGAPFAGYPAPWARGGCPLERAVEPAERAKRTAFARAMYGQRARELVVRPSSDRALRDALHEAARNGVRVVLLYAPEGPAFRSWYDPVTLDRFNRYIARVAAEFDAPVLDARTWLDEEDFSDSHHALQGGAAKFTARFARELAAVLAGR